MSAVNNIKLLKKIPQTPKLFVCGYCRELERIIRCQLPLLIQSLILLYYYTTDYFQSACDCCKIAENKLQVTAITPQICETPNVFCHHWIPSISGKIHKWKFRIDKKASSMSFTLISEDKGFYYDYTAKKSMNNDDHRYTHYAHGEHWYRARPIDKNKPKRPLATYFEFEPERQRLLRKYEMVVEEYQKTQKYKEHLQKIEQWQNDIYNDPYRCFKTGDIVLYTLDLNQNVFKCKINNEREWIISDIDVSEDIQYKLTLCMNTLNDKVTLIDYMYCLA